MFRILHSGSRRTALIASLGLSGLKCKKPNGRSLRYILNRTAPITWLRLLSLKYKKPSGRSYMGTAIDPIVQCI